MYQTQMEAAKKGIVTEAMKQVAQAEEMTEALLMEKMKRGQIVIPANIHHQRLKPQGVGAGLSTKINVNLGISKDKNDVSLEMQKASLAEKMGAHAVMDLSNFGKTEVFRQKLIAHTPLMVGTVPVYDAVGYLEKPLTDITPDEFLQVVRKHGEDGVDFVTIHAGLNKEAVDIFKRNRRKMNIVSRGGALLFAWMHHTGRENPFYEYFDKLLEICRTYDITLSLGDALRPGAVEDATDAMQIKELMTLGELTKRAWEKDVQVIIEGPGHMCMDEIESNVMLQKKLCHQAPFYVLGPLVTDVAPGYDHITGAIGGAIAASKGADFLCYVTPAEHLRLPDLSDVKEGIVASKIAAHAADLVRQKEKSIKWDQRMSTARQKLDWKSMYLLSIDEEKARKYRENSKPEVENSCTMCGKMCAVRTINEVMAQYEKPESGQGNI